MIAEHFLSLLEGVRRTRCGWMARCPSHTDKTPSLSVREGEDQRVLLHCFSGCSTLQICTALRLSLADLFPANGKTAYQLRDECRQRKTLRLEQAQKQQERGLAVDVLREAERLISKAQGFQDSHMWSNARRDRMLNQLADAYDVLDREGTLNEPVGI